MGTRKIKTETPIANTRKIEADVHELFVNRWSPRSFKSDPVDDSTLSSIFEAARWSMSCMNEQPWLFLYSKIDDTDRDDFNGLLVPGNREWADSAPVLCFALCRNNFERNDKLNNWAQFDTGAAWMALSLQARMLGLYTHGMAGFDIDRSYEVLNVDRDKYTVIAVFVIGHRDDPDKLSEKNRESEQPNSRKSLDEITHRGKLTG